ncbi:SPASM domain-containing protein [Candidatus Woesearchaeota archaeon]|nr:SPASM domain-containing protein [Candidatus Woesearchaeota archaeon]
MIGPEYSQFPKAIEIQTTSACNAACIVCPHPVVVSELPKGYMTDELFEKIIGQIGTKSVRVIPYLNSEPFLDPHFIRRLNHVSEVCPNAEIEVSTNLSRVDELARDKLRSARITEMRLSVFGFTKETYERIMPGLSWASTKAHLDCLANDNDLRKRISEIGLVLVDFPLMTPEDVETARAYCVEKDITFHFWGFLDRARNVPLYSNSVYRTTIHGCEQRRPLDRMHVGLDGRVILCCQDWRQTHILGDLNTQSIEEVWHSEKYQNVRRRIYIDGTNAPDLCKKCKLAIP